MADPLTGVAASDELVESLTSVSAGLWCSTTMLAI